MKVPAYSIITSDAIGQSQNEKYLQVQSFLNIIPSVNNPLQIVTTAMNNNITIVDNLAAEQQTITVKSGVDFTVNLVKMTAKPNFMVVGYASGEIITGYGIKKYISNSQLIGNIVFQSGNTTGVNVTICFM